MQVNILEAKNRLSELVRSAAAGEEVIIANRGKSVARLVSADHAEGLPSDDAREARNRKLDAIVKEMHRLPVRRDAFDPLEWDEWGLPR